MTPKEVYERAKASGRRVRSFEHIVAGDLNLAYNYAVEVIRGRFRLAEDLIASDSRFSYLYAKNVLGHRFIKGEPAIARCVVNSYAYAFYVLHGPFPLCHGLIKEDAENLLNYWMNVLKCEPVRWVHQAMVMHSFNNSKDTMRACAAYFNHNKIKDYEFKIN